MITFDEINELWNKYITKKEKNKEDVDLFKTLLGKLLRNFKFNSHENNADRCNTDFVLNKLKTNTSLAKTLLKERIKKREVEYENFINDKNGILGDDLTTDPIKTQKYISEIAKDIQIYKDIIEMF